MLVCVSGGLSVEEGLLGRHALCMLGRTLHTYVSRTCNLPEMEPECSMFSISPYTDSKAAGTSQAGLAKTGPLFPALGLVMIVNCIA